MHSDQQSLRVDFACIGTHGRFTRGLDFLAEQNFGVSYQKVSFKSATKVFSRKIHANQCVDGYEKEDPVNLSVDEKVLNSLIYNFESNLPNVARHLVRALVEYMTKIEKASIQ